MSPPMSKANLRLGVGRVEGHWECLSGIPAKPAEYLKSEKPQTFKLRLQVHVVP